MAPPRPRRTPGAKRDELIAAAARVMSREGVAATTTRRIAEEADVPLGTVHYWFATKDELVREVAAAHLEQVRGAGRDVEVDVAAAVDGGGSGGPAAEEALTRLRAALAAEESLDTGRRLSLYELTTWSLRTEGQAGTAREQYRAMRAAARSLCEPWLRAHRPQAPGDAVLDEAQLDALSALVVAFFDGLALSELADPDGTPSETVLELFSAMVGAWVAALPQP
ncbi:TetR/AcrR family transcriptional regulator [Kineococcus rhizosphaerae]|uniref:TetR family transcriptional regulator n=1 Tax=Kineococcus rhizosphaerae TaxID=559628 RepID=A0A2T0R8L0_9ACTN|nr:TetR/AcrR family transcriptional regulator [Kineococcus rhizosphaerae]PRY17511.1 TetR family transcriptional regulator [Kineococcus rhizosphaerae]